MTDHVTAATGDDDSLPGNVVLTVGVVRDPTPEQLKRAAADMIDRMRAYRDDPAGDVGPPGTRYLVLLRELTVTLSGVLNGCELLDVPVCWHGCMPDVNIRTATSGTVVVSYCPDCGVYLPKLHPHTHSPIMGLLKEGDRP